MKYFPNYGPKAIPSIRIFLRVTLLDKAYLMNVVNTLDPGLIIKTI